MQLTRASKFKLIVTYLLGGALIATFIWFYREGQANREILASSGVKTEALVTLRIKSGRGGTRIMYQFIINNRLYKGESGVSSRDRPILMPGDTITVVYDPNNPDLNIYAKDLED